MEISILEEKLLNKEVKEIETVVLEAYQKVWACLTEKCGEIILRGDHLEQTKAVNDYFESVVKNSTDAKYYGGYTAESPSYAPKIPDILKKRILDVATKDFLERVSFLEDEVENING